MRAAQRHRKVVAAHAAEYAAMLEAQGGGCAICGRPPATRRLSIDHDHRTLEVRGLLCHRCNRNLPTWVSPEWLRAAAIYLELPRAAESLGESLMAARAGGEE